MSNKRALFDLVVQHQIVGVVREETAEEGWEVAAAYVKGGIRFLEITLTTPDAFSLMARVVGELGEKGVIVVAGTVGNPNDAASSRRAGARALVSPHTDMRVIEYATEHDLLCIAGAATPTEIIRAWEAGADIVKVYPAPHLGGPSYIGTIRQPIRDVPMLAGGPIPLDAIDSYLEAGAIAVNLGASLAVPELVETKRWDEIARRAMLAVSIAGSRHEALSGSDSMVH